MMRIVSTNAAGTSGSDRSSVKHFSTGTFSAATKRFVLFTMTVVITWFAGLQAVAQIYYSQGNLPVNELASWNSAAGGGGTAPSAFTGTYTWSIQPGHDMTMTGNWTVGGTATVTLNGKLTVSGAYRVIITGILSVNGTLVNSGTYSTGSAVTASSGITVSGVYEHARDGGIFPHPHGTTVQPVW